MAQKGPRFSVAMMAICCGFLSLTVVAREAASSSSSSSYTREPGKYGTMHHQLYPGTPSPTVYGRTSREAINPLSVGSKLHRKTRESRFPLPRLAITSEELGTGKTSDRTTRRRRMEPKMDNFASPLVFMPPRGRRFGILDMPTEKRQVTIEQILEKGDYFVPNRGKKSPLSGGELMIKKGSMRPFDVLLGPGTPDEYFFPNRGKKEYFLAYEPAVDVNSGGGGRSPILGRGSTSSFVESKLAASASGFGAEVRHPVENRLRRNLLENLANEHKDTFFSSRGKRILPVDMTTMLWPTKTEMAELLPWDGTDEHENFSGQHGDVEAVLCGDAVHLIAPLKRPSS